MAFGLAVYPAVLLTYAGQTAYLIKNPGDYLEGFFKMIPMPVFWPMLIIATLSAIVASQGLITATFSVVKQSVALDYFPPVKINHTSEDAEGQVYSPEVNYGLMVLCLAVIFGFQSATQIGNAFGIYSQLSNRPCMYICHHMSSHVFTFLLVEHWPRPRGILATLPLTGCVLDTLQMLGCNVPGISAESCLPI